MTKIHLGFMPTSMERLSGGHSSQTEEIKWSKNLSTDKLRHSIIVFGKNAMSANMSKLPKMLF